MPIQLSGSLVITGSITTTGVITMSGSIASASYSSTSDLLQGTGSVGFTTTASFNAVSSSQQQISASYIALSASYNTFSGSASTRITANSSSIQQVSSSQQQISASLLNVIAIGATTGSNSFRADQSITGSLVVSSTITAQTLIVQTVTSSIVYSSGSNLFGNALSNTQTFTGSVNITGSLTISTTGTEFQVTNAGVKIGNVTTDTHPITGSVNITGSLAVIGSSTFSSTLTTGDMITNNTGGFRTLASQGYALRNDANNANLGALTRRSYWAGNAALDTQIYAETGYGIFLNVNGSNSAGLNISSSGNVGIGVTNPVSTQNGLDISSGGISLVLGADSGAATRTNVTSKVARIASYQYTNANTPSAMLIAVNDGTDNALWVGGGSGLLNSATYIAFYTTSSVNSLVGVERMRITSGGEVGIGVTPSAGNRFWVKGSDSTAGNTALYLQNSAGTSMLTVKNSNTTHVGALTGGGETLNVSTTMAVRGNLTGTEQNLFHVGNTGSGVNDGYMRLFRDGVVKVLIAADNSRGGDTYFNGGGSVLIGTTTSNSFDFAVGQSKHCYLGNTYQISSDDFGGTERQTAVGAATWGGDSNPVINLASVFPRLTFTSRALSILCQIITSTTSTTSCAALVLFCRTINGTWSSNIISNININGLALSSASGSGTSITLNFGTANYGNATFTIMNRA